MSALPQEVHNDRSNFIGGSDTAAILNISPWTSDFSLYQRKTGEYDEEITPAKQKIFNRGKRWEPIVIEMLVDELEDRGHDVEIINRNQRYVDPVHSFLAAEIDLELMIDGEYHNGEMKTVHPFAAKDWGGEYTDEIPLYYLAQVEHGLMVTGRDKAIIAALIGADDLRIHFANRDDELINIIRTKEVEFWDRVQRRDPPEPTSPEDIKRLYRIDSGAVLEADERLLELIDEASNKNTELIAAEKRLEVLTAMIKARMREAALLMHNGKKLATWKNSKDSVKTDWETAFRALAKDYAQKSADDIAAYIRSATTTKPGARPFSLK